MTTASGAVKKVRLPRQPHPAAMVLGERLRKASEAGANIVGLRGIFLTAHGTQLFALHVTDEEIDLHSDGSEGAQRFVVNGSVLSGDLSVEMTSEDADLTFRNLLNDSSTKAWQNLAKEWWQDYCDSRFMPLGVKFIASDSDQSVELGGETQLTITAQEPHLVELFTRRPLLPCLLEGDAIIEGEYPFIVAVNRTLIDSHLGGNW